MRVEILHIDECPNWVEAGERVRAALDAAGLGSISIGFRLLATREEAAAALFAGSPTILINGADAFPGGARTAELACRLYRTDTGLAGVPSAGQVAEAIRQHR